MKKVLLVLAAVVLVASGVAAVSAYEAHVINVRAHVENALSILGLQAPYELDFGTVFPEEWLIKDFTISTSESFCDENQWRMTAVNYTVWVEWKSMSDNGTPGDPYDDTYYGWLGDALYIGIVDPPYTPAMEKPEAAGGNLVWVGNVTPPGPPGALKVWDSPEPIYKSKGAFKNETDRIVIGLDVPVFEDYYNPLTDMLQEDGTYAKKPSGLDDPTVIIAKDDPRWDPEGVDLGVDLKIQVTNIWKK
jgi:hypothetical protein